MANMIEQSLLCKVLDAPDLEILHSNGVVEEMFLTCKDEIHFIIEHYNSYKQMPDKLTFLGRFKDFQMLEVTESTDYLVYKLKEAYTYTKLVPLIEDTAKVVKEDSIKAIQYLKEEIEKLEKSVPVSRNKDGYDIISNAGDRLTEYKKRCEVKGLIGIPTGIPKLDEITNGWLWGEDLVVLTGRTNVGKTWIGEYFATMAWNMGYKILMYSGEMSTAMVGFRFDTLNKHFSNMGLLNGSGTLGKKPDTDGAKYLQEDYEKYIIQLQQKSGFIVVTPDDFEGRKIYLSAFEGCIYDTDAKKYLTADEQVADFATDMLSSIAGAKPASGLTQNLTRANVRKLCANRGAGWESHSIFAMAVTEWLLMIEYASLDAQRKVGRGVCDFTDDGKTNMAVVTGATSGLGNGSGIDPNGGVDGKCSVSYRGEENLWGNIWTWLDKVNILAKGQNEVFVHEIGATVADDTTTGYKSLGYHWSHSNGYQSAFGIDPEHPELLIPTEASGSDVFTGNFVWQNYTYNGFFIAILGSMWAYGSTCGFALSGGNASGDRYRHVGGRLLYVPQTKVA